MKAAALSCLCVLGLFAVAQPAEAIIINVDRATFQASVTGGTIDIEDFDGFADGQILGTEGDVTYFSSGGATIVTDAVATSTPPNSLASTITFTSFLSLEEATFLFANPITAFAIDIITDAPTDGAYEAIFNTTEIVASTAEVFANATTGQFIGFSTDTPFTEITIRALTGFDFTLDTLVFGQAEGLIEEPTDVPEPGALLLLSGGLFGIAYARRRRQQRSTCS